MAGADSFPDVTGYFLDDRYELIELLGSGSFGVVYKAIDYDIPEGYDDVVAVKILPKAGQSAARLASIKREVAFHSTVADNEGVVTLLDTFDDAKWCYLVLEFCRGGDLFDQIVTNEAYLGDDELLREAFLSLVDAVQGCHDAGISHRDLKPENILTNKDGSRCYLADFGLGSDQPLVREFGVGTGLYMSPECVGELTARRSYDPFLSDIWSLGIILVNMITGQNPWAKASARDYDFRQFLMDPDFLCDAYPMSDGARDIVLGLLDLNPAHRMSLTTLRQEILSLDAFFRPLSPFERVVIEHEYSSIISTTISFSELSELDISSACAAESESALECKLARMASEIGIPRATSEPDIRVARDCSAGSAADSYSPPSSTAPCPSYSSACYRKSSCSLSRGSSGMSDVEEVPITPEGTTTTTSVTTAHMLWDRIMAGAHLKPYQNLKGVCGYESWQDDATGQMLMAQPQYHNCPEHYLVY